MLGLQPQLKTNTSATVHDCSESLQATSKITSKYRTVNTGDRFEDHASVALIIQHTDPRRAGVRLIYSTGCRTYCIA
jgi:hypothetical protein